MLEKGECSLLQIQASFPLLLQFCGIFLSVALFVYRTSSWERKRFVSSTSTSLLISHIVLYVTFLGVLLLICLDVVDELCPPLVVCLLLTLSNWVLNGASLYYSILPKFDIGVYMQIECSLAEVIFVLYTAMHVLLEAETVKWWYWPVLLGVIMWCFLCNIGFLVLLYGGASRSSSTGSDRGSYALLADIHGEQERVQESGTEAPSEDFLALGVTFSWFTKVLHVGYLGTMTIEDLPALPTSMTSMCVRDELQQQAAANHQKGISSSSSLNIFCCCSWLWKKSPQQDQQNTLPIPQPSTTSLPSLLSTAPLFFSLMARHRNIFVTQGLLKFISLCLSFSGPLLLGEMVKLIEKESDHKNVLQGVLLTVILGGSFLISTVVNVQYSIRGDILRIKLKNALSLSVFSRVIDLPLHEMYAKDISEAQASNMLQVDVDKVSSMVNSFHDLWSLPVQISIAFVLLYLQVDVAFVAGVVIIIVMIPINNYIAKQIGVATEKLMAHKDTRVKFISECFRGIKSIKASGWEEPVLLRSMRQRELELKYLSRRKYFDALCVFLWASMPLLVPFATFVTTVTLVKESLSVAQVFTTISLLNMLIFPMNAFPWIINGFVEAIVSFRRLSVVLIDPRVGKHRGQQGQAQFDEGGGDEDVDADSVSSVMLGGRAFMEKCVNKDQKGGGGRFYSFITNSSRLYSFIDDMLEDSAVEMDSSAMEEELMCQQMLPDAVLVSVQDMCGGWHPSHDDNTYSCTETDAVTNSSRDVCSAGEYSHIQSHSVGDRGSGSGLGEHVLFSIGPVTITNVHRGEVIVLCGSVGRGKSTLIYSLLQEAYVSATTITPNGDISVASNCSPSHNDNLNTLLPPFLHGTVSLCTQRPALHTGSIRSNILFQSPFDSRRYLRIMKGCCLDEDFLIATNPSASNGSGATSDASADMQSQAPSDEKSIGQGGNQLSGGQRLRVGLARALYARTDIVLLDDPLSALDTVTANRVMRFLYSLCREEQRVLVLSTNDVHLVCHCEDTDATEDSSTSPTPSPHETKGKASLLFLSQDNGKILQGSYSEVFAASAEFRHMVDSESQERQQVVKEDESSLAITESSLEMETALTVEKKKILSDEDVVDTVSVHTKEKTGEENASSDMDIEDIERGHIQFSVILKYLHAMSIGVAVVIVVSALCMQVTANGMTIWLAYWTDHEEDISNYEFLVISCAIVGANVFFTLIRSFSFAYGGLRAARGLYRQLTSSTLRTYLHFFEVQSLGRLLNRFGRDTDCIDEDLPFMLNIVLAQVFTLIGALVIIIYSSPLVVAVLCVVAYGYYRLQMFYRQSSRDMRRLESTFASPVGTLLMDCLANAPCIRAQQLQGVFDAEFSKALDKAQQVSLSSSIASQWLTMRLQLLGLIVIVSIALIAVINAAYEIVPMSGSKLGLALSYAFALVGYVNGLVDSVSRAEQELISVERVSEYVALPDEFDQHEKNLKNKEQRRNRNPYKNELKNFTGRPESESTASIGLMVSHIKKLFVRSGKDDNEPLPWPQNGQIELFDVSFSYAREHREYERLVASNAKINTRKYDDIDGYYDVDEESRELHSFALSDISLSFAAGSRTVVVGRTGSGKTSLLRAILNMSTSFDGTILVGGKSLEEIPKQLLRSSFGVISQETFLFTGTVRDNLDVYGDFSDAEVLDVLNSCGILKTFCQMKEGADEVSSEHASGRVASAVHSASKSKKKTVRFLSNREDAGATKSNKGLEGVLDVILVDSNLSHGQKQLLSVARILLRKPQFVLLDEASSSLDPLSEARMYSILQQYLPRTTTLLAVNHRYERSVIQELCPQVLELSKGQVVRFDNNEITLSHDV